MFSVISHLVLCEQCDRLRNFLTFLWLNLDFLCFFVINHEQPSQIILSPDWSQNSFAYNPTITETCVTHHKEQIFLCNQTQFCDQENFFFVIYRIKLTDNGNMVSSLKSEEITFHTVWATFCKLFSWFLRRHSTGNFELFFLKLSLCRKRN